MNCQDVEILGQVAPEAFVPGPLGGRLSLVSVHVNPCHIQMRGLSHGTGTCHLVARVL